MAITFVAAGTDAVAASGNLTVNYPAGIQTGDVLILHAARRDTVAVSLPAPWDLFLDHEHSNGAVDLTHFVASLVYDGTGSSVTITHTAGNVIMARIAAFRGVDTATPIRAATFPDNEYTAATSGTRALNGSFLVGSQSGDMGVFFACMADDYSTGYAINGTGTGWGTYTEWDDTESTLGADVSKAAWYALSTSTDPTNVGTFTVTNSAAAVGLSQSIVLAQAAAETHSGTAAVSAVATTTATGQKGAQAAVTASGRGVIWVSAAGQVANTASVTAVGQATASGQKDTSGTGTATGVGTPTASGSKNASTSTPLTAVGQVTAAGEKPPQASGQATVTATGQVTAVGIKTASEAVQVVGVARIQILRVTPRQGFGHSSTRYAFIATSEHADLDDYNATIDL